MTFEQFSTGSSVLHRADARTKIVAAAFLSLIVAISHNFATAGAGLLLALLLTRLARLSWSRLLHRLLLVNSFNIFLWIMLPLTYGGSGHEGLLLALLITIKSNGLVLMFISLLATSSVPQIGQGMQALGVPPALCMLLLFSYRYIVLIYEEFSRLHRAASLRCFHPRTNVHTYKTYGHLVGMIMVRSWNRAARVQEAMILRGFTGTFHHLAEDQEQNIHLPLLLTLALAGGALLLVEFIAR